MKFLRVEKDKQMFRNLHIQKWCTKFRLMFGMLFKCLGIAYKAFYSTQSHSHRNYLTRALPNNLKLPVSTTPAGPCRVSYYFISLCLPS